MASTGLLHVQLTPCQPQLQQTPLTVTVDESGTGSYAVAFYEQTGPSRAVPGF